jgi:tetratricopeptide (TPR) repeat protein
MDETLGTDRWRDAQAERERMRSSIEQAGSLTAFAMRMVRVAQAAGSAQPPDRAQELQATLAAVTAADLAAEVPPEAVGVLAAAGHHERAHDLAAMVAPESRSDAYYRIAIALKNKGHMKAADTAAAEAIAAAGSYARESGAHYVLEHLAYAFSEDGMPGWAQRVRAGLRGAGLPGAQDEYDDVQILADGGDIDGAWEAARRLSEPEARDRALGSIVVGALARAGRFQDAIGAAGTVEYEPGELFADIAVIAAEHSDTARTTDTLRSIPAEHRQWATHKAAAAWARAGRVDDAITLTQLIEDGRLREHAIREVASTLAQTEQVDSAISVWTAAPPSDHRDYFTADLAKMAARAGDIDGALQIAAAIDDDYPRRTAVEHAASAAALGGDMRRATALVRVIGHASGEDDAFAAVAKELAAAEQFDHADAAIGLIGGPTVQAATLVTVAGALAAAGDYRRSAAAAEKATQIADGNSSALIAWARALTLSGEPDRALAAAERAVRATESRPDTEKLTEALAAWSGALAASGRQAEALAAAERCMTAMDSPVEHWRSDQRYWRDRLTKNVAVIFAGAGLAEQAMMMARSLAQEHDRNDALLRVAETLAQRGLADQAIEALRGSTHFTSFRARDDLEKIARILARHGHGDGALRAAYALAEVDEFSGFAEYYVASLITDVAKTLAETGHVAAALQTVRKSRPSRRRPAAYAEIACAVARAGDARQAVEIAETHAGLAAVAKVASALAESGRTDEALPIAEHAIEAILTGAPRWPAPADAIALLDNLTLLCGSGAPDDGPQDGTAATAAALRAASEASALADPEERIAAQAQAAMGLASTRDPALTAQAIELARAVVEEARQAGASPFRDDRASVALAVYALTDAGQVAEALAGLSSLPGVAGQAILCGVAERLASHGRAGELVLLVSDPNGLPSISAANERICALTGLGRVYAETGEPGLVEAASSLAGEAGALAGELTQAYQVAVALSGQARLLAALSRPEEAAGFARRALAAADEPIGGWRGQVVAEAVDVLVRCNRIDEAEEAARSAPPYARAKCTVAVAGALWNSGEKEQAAQAISEEIAAICASGLRQAFYDLVCTELPKHPDLLRAWIGGGTEVTQISRELTAIERSWM